MKSKRVQDIIKEVAREHNLPLEMVQSIIRAPFGFTREKMKEGEVRKLTTLKSILIKKFGTFRVSEKRYFSYIRYIDRKRAEKRRNKK